ncbi:CDK-activating kinase assembly factor [Cystobasidium minutum MCA 4210]|uniref:CDK-activating kinase assembly factor n=1 Tax=Cystobasidium minutum MCA 4210 TaxID=1397322 RepID=UPI0034CECFE7|eukprot:jgi/Rhomi1/170438/fgenesh1_kg.4_\
MSASRKPTTTGYTRPMGTQRLPPLAGSSRSGTPSTTNGGNRASSAAQGPAQTQQQQQQQQAGLMKQNLLDKDRKMAEYSSPADKCPVCFSDRYLNPSLRLLVSKCYHKMCESCIDRIFTLGPGPCPICGQIIRKTQFMPQTYEDLGVEKEVVIRKRIAKIFNKTQEDFPDLKTYNDYLELVEDLTFNLINSIDVEETDRRILAYQRENAEQIDTQLSYEDQQAELVRLRDEEERRLKAERALEFAKQDAEEKKERQAAENELIRALEETSDDVSAKEVIKKQRAVALKKSSARHALQSTAPNTSDSKPSLLSKYMGFNRSTFSQQEKDQFEPEDPLQDYDTLWYDYRDLFELKSEENTYRDEPSEAAIRDAKKRAGGFDVKISVWERSIRSAVMGLTIRPLGSQVQDAVMA